MNAAIEVQGAPGIHRQGIISVECVGGAAGELQCAAVDRRDARVVLRGGEAFRSTERLSQTRRTGERTVDGQRSAGVDVIHEFHVCDCDDQVAADGVVATGHQEAAARERKGTEGGIDRQAITGKVKRVDRLRRPSEHGVRDRAGRHFDRVGGRGAVDIGIGASVIVEGVGLDAESIHRAAGVIVTDEVGAINRYAAKDTRNGGYRRHRSSEENLIRTRPERTGVAARGACVRRKAGEGQRAALAAGGVIDVESGATRIERKRADGLGRSTRAIDGVVQCTAGQRERSAAQTVGGGGATIINGQNCTRLDTDGA